MTQHLKLAACGLAAAFALAALPAQAALQGRDFDGDTNTVEAFYDTDFNITWLANGLAAQGTSFDDGTYTGDGRLTWQSAMNWAGSLTLGGKSDWRLPKAIFPDPTCSVNNGFASYGSPCKGSELGHLSWDEGVTQATPKGFTHAWGGHDWIWTQTEYDEPGNPGAVYVYTLTARVQGGDWADSPTYGKDQIFALAVHDGDVGTAISPVPEPETYALMLSGLAMLGFIGRRSQRRG